MADYVLVHGAWQGAWGWARLKKSLEERGQRVLAVDLPGHGERIQADLAKIALQDYIDTVTEEIVKDDLHDVVLVGHSLDGITVPYVAERISERIKRLVFISCLLPDEGKSALETLGPLDRFLYRLIVGLTPARRRGARIPAFLAKWKFCNDMDRETTKPKTGRCDRQSSSGCSAAWGSRRSQSSPRGTTRCSPGPRNSPSSSSAMPEASGSPRWDRSGRSRGAALL